MLVPVCLPASGGHGPIITPPAVGTGDSLHGRSSCCGAVTLAASAVPARGSLTRHTGVLTGGSPSASRLHAVRSIGAAVGQLRARAPPCEPRVRWGEVGRALRDNRTP